MDHRDRRYSYQFNGVLVSNGKIGNLLIRLKLPLLRFKGFRFFAEHTYVKLLSKMHLNNLNQIYKYSKFFR